MRTKLPVASGKRHLIKVQSVRSLAKGQSVIIQFILFFMIGLGVFIMIGNFFRNQSDMFRDDVVVGGLKLSASYITSEFVASNGCIECDTVQSKLSIGNSTAGYFTEVFLTDGSGIKVSTAPALKEYSSAMHKLGDYFELSGQAPSIKPISLTFNRNQNKLEISEG